jgi:Xaa-Pro dipeptidase
MVITIEPGIYLDDFGIRIEDLYVVKKNGFKKLSNAKILDEITL